MTMKNLLWFGVLLLAVLSIADASKGKTKKKKPAKVVNYAKCLLKPNPTEPSSKVEGTVYFKEVRGRQVEYKLDITGFDSTNENKKHGFHVHQYGTIANNCQGAGGHYNPLNKKHGSPDNSPGRRHVGDLGNIMEDKNGEVKARGTDKLIALSGNFNIQGRAIVVHSLEDDLGTGGDDGSISTGNAGARLACCVIVTSDGSDWP